MSSELRLGGFRAGSSRGQVNAAPIFDIATYGIVGDLFDVVPALTEELRGKVRTGGTA